MNKISLSEIGIATDTCSPRRLGRSTIALVHAVKIRFVSGTRTLSHCSVSYSIKVRGEKRKLNYSQKENIWLHLAPWPSVAASWPGRRLGGELCPHGTETRSFKVKLPLPECRVLSLQPGHSRWGWKPTYSLSPPPSWGAQPFLLFFIDV